MKIDNAIHDIGKMYASLNHAVAETSAKRALLIKCHNGGEIPRPGTQLYTTVLREVYTESLPSVVKKIHKQPVDGQYVEMLNTLTRCHKIDMRTHHMEPGFLRNIFEAQGVARSYTVELVKKPGAYFYVAFHFVDMCELTPHESEVIRQCVQDLIQVLE